MVNTNKIINYLTRKHQLLEQITWSCQELIEDELPLDIALSGLGDQAIHQANGMVGALKNIRLGLRVEATELEVPIPSLENFMLGESVTSFHIVSEA